MASLQRNLQAELGRNNPRVYGADLSQHGKTKESSAGSNPADFGDQSGVEMEITARRSCFARVVKPGRTEALVALSLSIFITTVVFSLLVSSAVQNRSSATLTPLIVVLIDTIVCGVVASGLLCLAKEEDGTRRLIMKGSYIDTIVSLIFIFLSLSVIVHAVYNLTEMIDVISTRNLLQALVPSFVLLLLVGLVKLYIAKKTGLASMKSASVITMVGAKMVMGVLISTLFLHHDETNWWMDPTFAIMISLSLLAYGCATLFNTSRSLHVCSFRSRRNSTDESEDDTSDGEFEDVQLEKQEDQVMRL